MEKNVRTKKNPIKDSKTSVATLWSHLLNLSTSNPPDSPINYPNSSTSIDQPKKNPEHETNSESFVNHCRIITTIQKPGIKCKRSKNAVKANKAVSGPSTEAISEQQRMVPFQRKRKNRRNKLNRKLSMSHSSLPKAASIRKSISLVSRRTKCPVINMKKKFQKLNTPLLMSSCYYALFNKKSIKIRHNRQKRRIYKPEVSYICNDKMCWHKIYWTVQSKRLVMYHSNVDLDENHHKIPKITELECYIYGLVKTKFLIQFQKLCEIIDIATDFDFDILRYEDGATVIGLKSLKDKNILLTAFECYELDEGPLRLNAITDGRSRTRIFVRPHSKTITKCESKPKNNGIILLLAPDTWKTMIKSRLDTRNVHSNQRREYGNLIHGSKLMFHVF